MIDLELEIDALMSVYQGAVPGACVGVLKGGVPIVRRAYGLADVEAHVAATTATNYRLASLTKQFTAAAILLLAEQALLSIEDSVRRWLTLPPAADGRVIRHLLTHTSGVADFEDLIPPGTTEQLRDADVLRLLQAENRGYFPPGASYRYSNSGYVLLGLIAARAAGEDFAAVLRNRIFQPLGMRTSVAFEAGVAEVAERAFGYGYGAAPPAWVRADQSLTSATLGDGGVYSSVEDLSRWDAALGDDRLLRPASLRLAFQPATPTEDPAVAYGFGWRVSGENRWHSGESVGFRHVIVRNLADRTSVIVLTNRDAPEPYRTALAIAEIARGACSAPLSRDA
jgi:CubicO group peptidase (beta-lactamase class C family)